MVPSDINMHLDHGCIGLAITDVSDKGAPAALFMMSTRMYTDGVTEAMNGCSRHPCYGAGSRTRSRWRTARQPGTSSGRTPGRTGSGGRPSGNPAGQNHVPKHACHAQYKEAL